MAVDGEYVGNKLDEDISASGETTCEAVGVREILTRIELDLAYSSEKVLNLDMLLMHMASSASDHESPVIDNDDVSTDSIRKAFEIDILSGILISEVKEIDGFMKCLQNEIADARQKIVLSSNNDMSLEEKEEKLHVAEESLSKSKDHVSEIKMQSAKFERILCFDGQETYNNGVEEFSADCQSSSSAIQWKTLTIEQQRHTLQMLEKSLARELDLEKKLSDAKHNEEEIRLKLHYAEHETDCLEEAVEAFLERLFEAENASETLNGISKELMGKLQLVQFNLNSSIHRETETRHKLENGMLKLSSEEIVIEDLNTITANRNTLVQKVNDLKTSLEEAEKKSIAVNSEALVLREKVNSLEQQLTGSSILLQLKRTSIAVSQEQPNTSNSDLTERENVIINLKENIFKAESRANRAEAKCTVLTETNSELNRELGFLKGDGAKKSNFLEKKLEESDVQLDNAKASADAIEEQQSMLYSALSDMEHLIEDLKTKVSKAEKRAESADSKCNLFSETNSELNEELGFLRGRLQCLENSLRQSNNAKTATAKDISIRTKVITDLVTKLALERERLQMQISALRKENKILVEKYWKTNDSSHVFPSHNNTGSENKFRKSSQESVTESPPASFKVETSGLVLVHETGKDTSDSMEDEAAAELKTVSVRTIEASQLRVKHAMVAALVLFLSVLAVHLLQLH